MNITNDNLIEQINDLNNQINLLYVQADTTAGPQLKKNYATCFSLNTKYESLDDNKKDEVIKKIALCYPDHFNKIQHGDLFENTCERGIGYRSNGRYMFVTKNNKLNIINLSYYPDDYGSLPQIFKGIEEFPFDYWNDMEMSIISLDGSHGRSS